MSLTVTRNNPATYEERIKRADALGVLAVAGFVAVILAVAFGPALLSAMPRVLRGVAHSGAAAGSYLTSTPLDAAFAAIIGVVVVAIGLAIRERRADEDREVFDVR